MNDATVKTRNDRQRFRRCALVICNHDPHPREKAGESRRNEQWFYFCIVPAVRGKYQGFVLYKQKGSAMRGKLPCFYQLTITAVWGL